MTDETAILALCDRIRQTAYDLHVYLKDGHLEKVYENGLANRLRKLGLQVEQQYALKVYDEDGSVLGDYYADLLVENEQIVELKACKALASEHTAQVLGYLRASRLRHAMLINFGAHQIEIKKLIL
jgi:GxxExxY protein